MTLDFTLAPDRSATAPPERRGIARDGVRLLVATTHALRHERFADLPRLLSPGDLLVVNTSATLPAAVDAARGDGRPAVVHFSTRLAAGRWVVEVRDAGPAKTGPALDAAAGERLRLPGGEGLSLDRGHPDGRPVGSRLWETAPAALGDVPAYLARHGRPIRYAYVPHAWPLADYQTVFATHPGSAEMPSAGRPFTDRLVTALVSHGIAVAPVTLHTGVSSLEAGEPPYAEAYAVPASTAGLVNATRAGGGRVVAVGTTVVRALETAADETGRVRPRSGRTGLILGPARPARAVDGLITGLHPPGASHLDLLEAVAGREIVARAYAAALAGDYLWHEFGDSCLLLPERRVGPRRKDG